MKERKRVKKGRKVGGRGGREREYMYIVHNNTCNILC